MSERGMDIKNGNIVLARFGTFPDGTTDLRISKPGYDARTANDSQLIFTAKRDIFKVGITDQYTWPDIGTLGAGGVYPASTYETVAIPHNLGSNVTPLLQCYMQVPATSGNNPWGVPVFAPWNNLAFLSQTSPYSHNFTDAATNNQVIYTLIAGTDNHNLYLGRRISNADSQAWPTTPITFTYFVYANSAT